MSLSKRKSFDSVDCQILHILQTNGRISNVELSRQVGLSPTPCLERVRRLEREGVISNYTANLNPKHVGVSLLVFIEITLSRSAPDIFEVFNAAILLQKEIQECHLVSGDFDYLLKARVADMDAYRTLLGESLLKLPYVSDTRTYVVMEEVKQVNHIQIQMADA
jgi:Lrp/AsnC family leucine-responsive transcriptional regulator